MDPAVVEFENVTYRIGNRDLVSELNLEVRLGEVLVLLGESGSGKTTSLRLMNGLLFPGEGSVRVEGMETTSWDPIQLRKRIGYVIQEVGLFPHMSVERNVGLVPFLNGWKTDSIQRRVSELLELLGLEPGEFARRYPDELSGGQRQRVGIARALAADPPLLLMDEPFGALDPLTRQAIRDEFADLQKRLGKTVVLVTHDVQEAFLLGSRIGLMDQGRMVELGTPSEFFRSRNARAQAFVEVLQTLSRLTAGNGEGV